MVEINPQQRPIATKGMNCPLYKQDVSEVCHKCEWFTKLKGKHPQSEQTIDSWGCAIAWLPILTIEAAQAAHQGAAATESFRNDVVKINQLTWERDKIKDQVRSLSHG